MGLTTQDFIGTDLTGVSPITAGDLNNLWRLTQPKLDILGDGKGLTLYTHDSAANTPVVPDAAGWTVWKTYIWLRVPYLGSNNNQPILYVWNDNIASDPILKKWKQVLVDITSLQAEVDSALAASQSAEATANVSLTTANTANSTASTAFTTANAAQTTADGANSLATVANGRSISALSTANNANSTANTALATAGTKKDINDAINPGTAGQKPRTKSDASGVEWFDEVKQYVKVSYSPAKNTAPEASAAADWQKRKINTEDSDLGSLVSIASDIITFGTPGIYRVNIICPAADVSLHKAALCDVDSGLALLIGTNADSNTHTVSDSIITGLITITSIIKNLAVFHYTSVSGTLGPPSAVNIDYPKISGVATKEVYLTCEFWKIN